MRAQLPLTKAADIKYTQNHYITHEFNLNIDLNYFYFI